MTSERERVEHLIAGLERIEALVVEFRRAITEAVGDIPINSGSPPSRRPGNPVSNR